ncbi:Peptidylprolyl isomerase [Aphelenchoides bicaudatus]|nr:Peptidylprolyl isomerase [Aphelenchoides bicaudatus]
MNGECKRAWSLSSCSAPPPCAIFFLANRLLVLRSVCCWAGADMRSLIICLAFGIVLAAEKEHDKNTFQGQKLSWKDDDGLEIKIVKPISSEKCKIKSQNDADGKEIGSNFGKTPYTFELGTGRVIPGMDRAMEGMCIGEKRKVVIPPELGFSDKGRERDNLKEDQKLYYLVQLVDLFRPVPGEEWTTEEGIKIKQTHKISEDECRKSASGDTLHQQYKLHLEDGTFVDSSYSRGTPFIFKLNAGQSFLKQSLLGMDIAMTGMCEGERRHVIIPPKYGYGDTQRDTIPPKSTLYFDIVLEKLIKKDEL